MCPYCQRDAPVVYRGVLAYCTACGAMRGPLTPEKSVNLAGQPSQVGGTVAKVFGWLVLFFGVALAGIVIALFQAIFPAGVVGWAIGLPLLLLALATGVGLLMGGKSLTRSGKETEESVREKAIYALAQNRGGILTKEDVARSLNVSVQEGDAFLTRLAKTKSDDIAVDVDDSGQVLFRFRTFAAAPRIGVRVDVARPGAPPPASTYEAEFQAMAEAEQEAQGQARRAR